MTNSNSITTWVFVLGNVVTSIATAQQGATGGQWPTHGGDKGSTKYAPLDQITADNFGDLEVAWKWDSIDADVLAMDGVRVRPEKFESTPLMVDGVLYTSTSFSQVAAINAGTGETIWKYDTGSWRDGRPANMGFIHRGVSYWTDGDDERIIIATGNSKLIALNAKTGKPISSFGENGRVDLFIGLNRPGRLKEHQVNSPPMICRDVIITGCVIADAVRTREATRGDVRAYDVRTGEKLWQFVSIPQEGEFGNETWEDGSWKYSGNTNVWSIISADEELGYVYLPFGAPTSDYYGGERPGDNLYANSLVCVDVETGKRVWHFQTVHHDLWDYDIASAPNLVDVVVDGKAIKAVAQVSKTGFTYVFDRVTGEPVWPIIETPVPQSTVPGEKTSPTQPIPTKPPSFSVVGVTEETIVDYTPELKKAALEIVKEYGFAPIFTPPSEKGVFFAPSGGGGANWSGAALDPETSMLYVAAISSLEFLRVGKPDPNRSSLAYHRIDYGHRIRGPKGHGLIKSRAGIIAIDLKQGTHAWVGSTDGGKGEWGWSFPLATKSLVLAGKNGAIVALDKSTGKRRGIRHLNDANGVLIGSVTGGPMTYMHEGKQYIVTPVTDEKLNGSLVALALP